MDITDDMICAWRNGTGQCHGDSGGPYLLLSNNNNNHTIPTNTTLLLREDIQIGIVSFGVGCAHPKLPAVGSRTSATRWIRHAMCLYSQYPPDYFDCDQYLESDMPSMAPSSPTISSQPTVQHVSLTLMLRLDMFPKETGWEIWDDSETILYASRPAGTYNTSHLDTVIQEKDIWVHPGNNYYLIITDSWIMVCHDGASCMSYLSWFRMDNSPT